ncbi:unnamed protein product [Phytomonas sp. EM1]|nr:unnamed protein product [Phytomonas sp. EM1]|eukprot:CCW61385.1 unnamed protein product [Phytomonas sp. isolate EM1]
MLWQPDLQRFAFLDRLKEEDAGVCSSLKELAVKSPLLPYQTANPNRISSPECGNGVWLSNCLRCEALYGVLPLGNHDSVLLYVAEKAPALTLHVGEKVHEVFRVVKLAWMRLPSLSSRRPKSGEPYTEDLEQTKDSFAQRIKASGVKNSLEDEAEACSLSSLFSQGEESDGPKDRFDEATISAYLKVVDRFCAAVSRDMGKRSYLYYSPTINLAMSPEEILESQQTNEEGEVLRPQDNSLVGRNNLPSRGSGRVPTDASLAKKTRLRSCEVFQWNYRLLEPFHLPTLRYLLKTSMKQIKQHKATSSESDTGESELIGLAKGTLREEQSYVRELMQLKSLHATLGEVSLLFIPSFVRGYAAQRELFTDDSLRVQLTTRLSCCWAGTRYNRRGLEPGESGICANLAISSVWVSKLPTEEGGRGGGFPRTAVLSIVRGSVPRRWEQPANLSFKPPLRISAAGNAAEELDSHLHLLNSLLRGLRRLCMVDTTSTNPHEKPLSDAFHLAFERWREGPTTARGSILRDVCYMKYDMKIKLKTLPLAVMREDLLREVRRAVCPPDASSEAIAKKEEEEEEWVSFTTFSGAPSRSEEEEEEGEGRVRVSWRYQPQSLYYRINCLDCLDRTNVAQALLADGMLPYLLASVLHREGDADEGEGEDAGVVTRGVKPQPLNDPSFQQRLIEASAVLRELFAEQGIALSMMYTGVGAHFITFLRGGNNARYRPSLHEGMIALRRWYLQNFRDGLKQDTVSLVTRQHDPAQFSCNIEGPFSRDLTGMNLLVLYGILASVVPLIICVIFAFFSVERAELRLHGTIACLWIAYFLFVYQKLSKYCVTYTNQALLNHSI